MKYEGRLYARVAGQYVPTEMIAKDVDARDEHIADLEAGTERLNNALTVLVDINGDRMTQAEWDRYDAALTEKAQQEKT